MEFCVGCEWCLLVGVAIADGVGPGNLVVVEDGDADAWGIVFGHSLLNGV